MTEELLMEKSLWDQYLIEFCSPTLAGMKSGSLFRMSYDDQEQLEKQIAEWNVTYQSAGIAVKVLKREAKAALIYVYRERLLQDILARECVWELLKDFGYRKGSLEQTLNTLSHRLKDMDDFPHEIGLLLGYPYEDVKEFICREGRDCLYCGYWKVYSNLKSAKRLFAQYDRCIRQYRRNYQKGILIQQMVHVS